MEQKDLVQFLSKLRDMDITKKFEDRVKGLEEQFKVADEKGRELLTEDFNRLANEIEEEKKLNK